MNIHFSVKEICILQDLPSEKFKVQFTLENQKLTASYEGEATDITEEYFRLKEVPKKEIKIEIKGYNESFPKDELKGTISIPTSVLDKKQESYSKWVSLNNVGKTKNIKGAVKINLESYVFYDCNSNTMPFKHANSSGKGDKNDSKIDADCSISKLKDLTTEDIIKEINAQNMKAFKPYLTGNNIVTTQSKHSNSSMTALLSLQKNVTNYSSNLNNINTSNITEKDTETHYSSSIPKNMGNNKSNITSKVLDSSNKKTTYKKEIKQTDKNKPTKSRTTSMQEASNLNSSISNINNINNKSIIAEDEDLLNNNINIYSSLQNISSYNNNDNIISSKENKNNKEVKVPKLTDKGKLSENEIINTNISNKVNTNLFPDFYSKLRSLVLMAEQAKLESNSDDIKTLELAVKNFNSTYSNNYVSNLPDDSFYLKLEVASIVDSYNDIQVLFAILKGSIVDFKQRHIELGKTFERKVKMSKIKIKALEKKNAKLNALYEKKLRVDEEDFYQKVISNLNMIYNHKALEQGSSSTSLPSLEKSKIINDNNRDVRSNQTDRLLTILKSMTSGCSYTKVYDYILNLVDSKRKSINPTENSNSNVENKREVYVKDRKKMPKSTGLNPLNSIQEEDSIDAMFEIAFEKKVKNLDLPIEKIENEMNAFLVCGVKVKVVYNESAKKLMVSTSEDSDLITVDELIAKLNIKKKKGNYIPGSFNSGTAGISASTNSSNQIYSKSKSSVNNTIQKSISKSNKYIGKK